MNGIAPASGTNFGLCVRNCEMTCENLNHAITTKLNAAAYCSCASTVNH